MNFAGNTAQTLEDGQVNQEVALVVRTGADHVVVQTNQSGEYRAKRAVSCLVPPVVDDLVLVAVTTRGDCYVLAVLERDDMTETELSVDGDLAIRSHQGKVTLAAKEGIGLVTANALDMVSKRLNITAFDANVFLEKLAYAGEAVRTEVGKVKVFGRTFDAVLERFSQRVQRSYRTVEQHDQLRAESIDYKADKTLCLRSDNTVMTAKQLVKLDGEQIHIG